MSEVQRDTQRAIRAAHEIIDGRDPLADMGVIMVTLDHVVAAVLLATQDRDPRLAAAMLNEGLVPGVEERLSRLIAKTEALK